MEQQPQLRQMIADLTSKIDQNHQRVEERHTENLLRFNQIESNQTHLDECLDDLKKKLFGNGRPGVVQLQDERISSLEKNFYRSLGAIGAATFIINIVLILLGIFHKSP